MVVAAEVFVFPAMPHASCPEGLLYVCCDSTVKMDYVLDIDMQFTCPCHITGLHHITMLFALTYVLWLGLPDNNLQLQNLPLMFMMSQDFRLSDLVCFPGFAPMLTKKIVADLQRVLSKSIPVLVMFCLAQLWQ